MTTEAELMALRVEADIAAGQFALMAFVFLACIAATALVTYVADNVHHDRHRKDRDP